MQNFLFKTGSLPLPEKIISASRALYAQLHKDHHLWH